MLSNYDPCIFSPGISYSVAFTHPRHGGTTQENMMKTDSKSIAGAELDFSPVAKTVADNGKVRLGAGFAPISAPALPIRK